MHTLAYCFSVELLPASRRASHIVGFLRILWRANISQHIKTSTQNFNCQRRPHTMLPVSRALSLSIAHSTCPALFNW